MHSTSARGLAGERLPFVQYVVSLAIIQAIQDIGGFYADVSLASAKSATCPLFSASGGRQVRTVLEILAALLKPMVKRKFYP